LGKYIVESLGKKDESLNGSFQGRDTIKNLLRRTPSHGNVLSVAHDYADACGCGEANVAIRGMHHLNPQKESTSFI
jgi:hypothetical protein